MTVLEQAKDTSVPPPGSAPSRFRRDIEGLRAVAVVLVVLYHAGVPLLTGGYIGVDVFFVISGFLITGLIATELERTRRVSLRDFYARRIRRLLPASVLVLLVTLLGAQLLLAPLQIPDIASDVRAAALYVSNIWFAHTGADYLANQAPSPVQHYWSLGVEEQFYLLWPVTLLLVSWRARNARVRLAVALTAVAAVSFALCIVITAKNQPDAFFLLPTRAWELALGGLIALSVDRLRRLGPSATRVARVATWVGLAVIVLGAMAYDESIAFPGWFAAVPVLGAVAVIAGGTVAERGGARSLLDIAPFQYLGRISYSLYLWHWPLIVLPTLEWGDLPPLTRAGLVALALLLAAMTFAFVESPWRAHPWLVEHRNRTFAFGAALTAAAVLATFLVPPSPRLDSGRDAAPLSLADFEHGIPAPQFVPANMTPSLDKAEVDVPGVYLDGCSGDFATAHAKPCFYGVADAPRTMAIIGDSHAAVWVPALEDIAGRDGWRLMVLTKTACPATDVEINSDHFKRVYTECTTWRREALAQIAEANASLVVIADAQLYEHLLTGSGPFQERWRDGVERTIRQLPTAAHVVVLGDTPKWPSGPNDCLSEHLDDPAVCSRPRTELIDPAVQAAEREAALDTGAQFVNPAAWLCTDQCPAIAGTVLMYRDGNHITATLSKTLAPLLAAAIGA